MISVLCSGIFFYAISNSDEREASGWAWWHTPIISALEEAKVGGSPEVGSLRPA